MTPEAVIEEISSLNQIRFKANFDTDVEIKGSDSSTFINASWITSTSDEAHIIASAGP